MKECKSRFLLVIGQKLVSCIWPHNQSSSYVPSNELHLSTDKYTRYISDIFPQELHLGNKKRFPAHQVCNVLVSSESNGMTCLLVNE